MIRILRVVIVQHRHCVVFIRHCAARHSWRVRSHSHRLKLSHFSCFKGPRPPITQPGSAFDGFPGLQKTVFFFRPFWRPPFFRILATKMPNLSPKGPQKPPKWSPKGSQKTNFLGIRRCELDTLFTMFGAHRPSQGRSKKATKIRAAIIRGPGAHF